MGFELRMIACGLSGINLVSHICCWIIHLISETSMSPAIDFSPFEGLHSGIQSSVQEGGFVEVIDISHGRKVAYREVTATNRGEVHIGDYTAAQQAEFNPWKRLTGCRPPAGLSDHLCYSRSNFTCHVVGTCHRPAHATTTEQRSQYLVWFPVIAGDQSDLEQSALRLANHTKQGKDLVQVQRGSGGGRSGKEAVPNVAYLLSWI